MNRLAWQTSQEYDQTSLQELLGVAQVMTIHVPPDNQGPAIGYHDILAVSTNPTTAQEWQ